MNVFAKIPIEKTLSLLSIQDETEIQKARYYYLKNSDEIINAADLKQLDAHAGQLDYTRKLDAKARLRIHRLTHNDNSHVPTVKADPIKVYLYIHFCLTDYTKGIAEEMSLAETAQAVGCTEKTVTAALNTLEEKGYISYRKLNPKYVTVTVNDYAEMFRKAENGGHGYLSFGQEGLEKILKLRHLNEIRIALISVFEACQHEYKSASKSLTTIISIDRYKEALPNYIRPCHIHEALNSLNNDVIVFSNNKYRDYRVSVSRSFSSKPVQNSIRQEARHVIRERFRDIAATIEEINREMEATLSISGDWGKRLRPFGIRITAFNQLIEKEDVECFRFRELHYTSDLIESLSEVAVNFDLTAVLHAIGTYYTSYVRGDVKIDNIPGLITSIIKEEMKLRIA